MIYLLLLLNQYESALCFRADHKSVTSVSFNLLVLSFVKVLVYRFISSSTLWDLPSVAKTSRSNKLGLYRHVPDYNGLFIFNFPMPRPCLAKYLKITYFFENKSWIAFESICLKVFVRLHRNKGLNELPEYQKVCSLQVTRIKSNSVPFSWRYSSRSSTWNSLLLCMIQNCA